MKSPEKITLVKGEEIINKDGKNAEIFNILFSNEVESLKILEYRETDSHANDVSHPIFKAILKYRNHSNIVAIKDLNKALRFDFCRVSVQDVVKEIKKLSTWKAIQYADLPAKILKENSDIFGNYICNFLNDCVGREDFLSISKTANITLAFKEHRDLKDNYWPVSILPVISEILKSFCVNKLWCS